MRCWFGSWTASAALWATSSAWSSKLGSLGVDLVSLRDTGMDTTGPSGRLIFHVMGAVAEFERAMIQERVRAGVAAARRRGKRLGRPKVEVPVARAQRLRAQGRSLSEVAQILGVSRSTLHRALPKNPSSDTARSAVQLA